jgi:hypothetical protein
MPVNLDIPSLGNKFQDYRQGIPGDSFSWGPVITATAIRYFTFHHSVTKPTGNWKEECNTIANLHINGNKWGGVGYRFIICSDGTVAYVGDLGRGGSAVANHNHDMFSACFIGDFTKHLPTDAQIDSAHKLAEHFLTKMPQYPNLKSWDQIKGHKDFNATACPGSSWPNDMRDRVIKNIPYAPTPQPPTPTPPPVTPTDWEALYNLETRKTKELTVLVKSLGEQVAKREAALQYIQDYIERLKV